MYNGTTSSFKVTQHSEWHYVTVRHGVARGVYRISYVHLRKDAS